MLVIKWRDSLNFIRKLSFRKIWNATKVIASFFLSSQMNRVIQWGLPFNISIEPTTSCNLGCPECPSGLKSFTRDTGTLSVDFYNKFLHEVQRDLIYLYFYFQGEPYLHPDFLSLVKAASEKNIYTVTSTNAHFLSPRKATETVQSGLDRILISIDGASQETYESYRKGGKLAKVIEGTKNLVKAKSQLNSSTPHIIIQFLVVKPNEHEIPEILQLGKDLGVDEVKLKTAQVYDFKNGNELIPSIEQYSRYRKNEDGSYRIKNKLENKCWKLWHSCVVTWDGNIVPCCFDKDAKYEMGSLQTHSFQSIWGNKNYKAFRGQLVNNRKSIDICTNCTEGLKVWAE